MVRRFLIFSLFTLLFNLGCTDPVKPEFAFEEGLVFIEGLATTLPGASRTRITQSAIEFGVYRNIAISDAKVQYINVSSGSSISLEWNGEMYMPPQNFSVKLGEDWRIHVILSDGREYQSTTEKADNPTEIESVETSYTSELTFDVGSNSFVPGHSLLVSFSDPAEEKNYYFWQFRTFERIIICKVCNNGYFRDDMCNSLSPSIDLEGFLGYYTYTCEEKCWQIRYGQNIKIFDDQFVNGLSVNRLSVGEIPLFTKRNILIELQQFALSRSAFEYYQTLKDIIDNNSGFNAPPPASLVGNLFNVKNRNEFVLGRFTVAAVTTKRVFLPRLEIQEPALESILTQSPEGFGSLTPDPKIVLVPCEESRYRTSIQPNGWQD